jgi:hypothetical protein
VVANAEAKPVAKPANQVANAAEPPAAGVVGQQAADAATSDDVDGGLFGLAGVAGVSKTGKQREQRVSPGPVPDPGVASNEATTSVASLPPSAASDKPKRGTRIPENFAVSPQMVAWARQHAAGVDIGRELIKFKNYWAAKAGKDATKLDWVATWENWMLKAAESSPSRASPNGRNSGANRHVDDLTPEQRSARNPFAGAVHASQVAAGGTP